MNYIPLLLTVFAVDFLSVMIPGPNFVVVVETAVFHRTRAAVAAVCGVATGDCLWSLAALFGMSTVFKLWPWLYGAMRILGGAYLIYLGIMALRSSRKKGDEVASAAKPQAGTETGRGVDSQPEVRSCASAYLRGVATTITNPKSVVYWGSIFALFLKPDMPVWVQASAVGIGVFDALVWYGAAAFLFSSGVVKRFYARIDRWIRRVTGAVMIGFGTKMLLDDK